jgi:phosphate starvation-inducible PhoH-like protein
MNVETSQQIDLSRIQPFDLFGERDANLRRIEERFGVAGVFRKGVLTLSGPGPAVEQADRLVRHLVERVARGKAVDVGDVDYLAALLTEEGPAAVEQTTNGDVLEFERRTVSLKSLGQQNYVDAIRNFDIVFGIGPAGTGKTYLAVAMAVLALKTRVVERIVLTRPAVEAGENLGFLPGTFEDKIDPYLRPLYDALRDLVSHDRLRRYLELGVLEIAPLAYMRGRTLSRAFVVLDEAQNTTLRQMKMFLTRLGPQSQAVITGDITQVDLPRPEESGLIRVQSILENAKGIAFVYFQPRDVVRHRLVREILSAFERHQEPQA